MTSTDLLLVSFLGRTDGLFGPLRDFEGYANANFYLARQEYFAHGGIPIRSRGGNRQKLFRTIDNMASAGQITVSRQAKGRWPCVRLSDSGEERARALCALPDIAAGFALLAQVAECSGNTEGVIPEWVLCGFPGLLGGFSKESTE